LGPPFITPLCIMSAPQTNPAEALLAGIGLSPDFMLQLGKESDWSLIIKLHAMFEAIVGSLIVRQLNTPDIEEVVAHLDFNNARSGKVAFARALGLVGKREVAFLRGFSELRNTLVHDIRNVQFNLGEYVRKLDSAGLKKFKNEIGAPLCGITGGERVYAQFLKQDPRMIVFLAAYSCLLILQFNVSAKSRNALVEALLQRTKQ